MNEEVKIKRPEDDEMCQVGYHLVKGHQRVCESGTKTWVDAHIRKNHGKRIVYLSENLLFVYWKNKKKYPLLNSVKGFPSHNELDSIIQFWLEYWQSQGEAFPEGLAPLYVKVLIAIESAFDSVARSKTSSAIGLMQVLSSARNALQGTNEIKKNEVKSNYVSVSEEQLEDPVVNIAMGTRWLAHKFYLLRNHKDRSLKQVITNYHSADKAGNQYAEKILDLYNGSK
jgi:hypothetical protein